MADGLLAASLAWQEVIDSLPSPEERIEAGRVACDSLRSIDGFRGSRRVIAQSELAFIIGDEPEAASGIQYREVLLKGWLGHVVYADMMSYGALTWPIYDAQVLREPKVEPLAAPTATQADRQTDGSRRPVYMPVGFIDYVLCAP